MKQCERCVSAPNFGSRFTTLVCGSPERCLLRPPAPEEQLDAWDVIVGIPIDVWMRIDTHEQLEWARWLREHPMPRQGRPAYRPDPMADLPMPNWDLVLR